MRFIREIEGSYINSNLHIKDIIDDNVRAVYILLFSFVFFTLSIISSNIHAQCESSLFELSKDLYCQGEYVNINYEISSNYNYTWDFCSGDLASPVAATLLSNHSDFYRARSLKIIKSGNNFYGFTISSNNNNLLRLNFGSDITSSPVITDLGTLSGALSSVFDFDMVQFNDVWYLFAANSGNNTITRLNFNDGIEANPSTTNLGGFGHLDEANGIVITKSKGIYYGFVSETSHLTRLTFGTDLENLTPAVERFSVVGSSVLRGISFIQECSNWKGVVTSYSTNSLYSISFSDGDFSGTPEFQVIPTGDINLRYPSKVILANEGAEFYAYVMGAVGNLYKFHFGESISDFTPIVEDLGTNGLSSQAFTFDIINEASRWYGFTIDMGNRKIARIDFTDKCSATESTSVEGQPAGISYSQAGKYYITLKATNELGSISYYKDSIEINESVSPDVSFTSDGICMLSPVEFIPVNNSGTVTDYSWSFGNGQTATGDTVQHQFGSPGEYLVQLEATDGTCSKIVIDTINIYKDAPEPSFELNAASLCTNTAIIFENTTVLGGIPASLVVYEWDINGEVASAEERVSHTFLEGGIKFVKLTSSIPGCSSDSIYSFAVNEGTEPILSFSNTCEDSVVSFTNQSIGDVTNVLWDLGNGVTSNKEHPSVLFEHPGDYEVSLTIDNSVGCETKKTAFLTIYERPVAGFTNSTLCEELQVNFNDTSNVNGGNITERVWIIDRADSLYGISPEYSFSAKGEHELKLLVSSDKGCQDSLITNLSVQPAPEISYTNSVSCLGSSTSFYSTSSTSEGTITGVEWNIDGHHYTGDTIEHLFSSAGVYPVELSVSLSNGCRNTEYDTLYISNPEVEVRVNPAQGYDKIISAFILDTAQVQRYTWYFEGETISSEPSFTFSATTGGTKELTLNLQSLNGCSYDTTFMVDFSYCLSPSFTLSKDEYCQGETVGLQSNTFGAIESWDYCSGDLELPTTAQLLTGHGDFYRSRSLKVIKEDDMYYGFAISSTMNNLLRLDFGADLTISPTITNLGTLSGSFSSVFDFDMVQYNDIWYAFVANSGDNSIVRLKFIDGLDQFPEAVNLGGFGELTEANGLTIAQSNGIYYAFVSETTVLSRLTLGTDIENIAPIVDRFNVAGSNTLRDISFVRECSSWYGMVTSYANHQLYSIKFSNGDFSGVPQIEVMSTENTHIRNPANITIANEGAEYYGYVMGADGKQYQLNFGMSISGFSPQVIELGTNGLSSQAFSFDLINEQSKWYGFAIDMGNQKLARIDFTDKCSATETTSVEGQPAGISYSQAGKYYITLKAADELGSVSYYKDSVEINENVSPEVSFTSDGVCMLSPVEFIPVNNFGTVTDYIWSFGNGQTTKGDTVQHQYNNPGTYNLRLDVSNGTCSNFITKEITIYEDAPKPSFDYEALALCTTNEINFLNSSDKKEIPDSLISYLWNFNNEFSSSAKTDTIVVFDNPGEKTVTLTSAIPGCSNDTTVIYTINQGAAIDFSMENACADEEIAITNTTTDEVVSFEWSLGNEVSSEEINPAFTYSEHGDYNILLKATNDFGCVTSKEKTLTIHALPTANFDHDISCEGNITSFNDLSTVELANITNWEWEISGEKFNNSSLDYTFSEVASHDVTLNVTSQYNCTSSITKTVSVMPSPVAGFSTDKLCINEPVVLTDQSAIATGSIVDRRWIIGSNIYSEKEVNHRFNDPGRYNIELIVTGSNRCYNSIEKEIIIHEAPEINLIHEVACAGQPLEIGADISSNDPIVSYNWFVNSQPYGGSSSIDFTGITPGTAAVNLLVTTEGSCLFNETNQVTINATPSADFEASTIYGGAPLEVYFQDFSSGGSGQAWMLNDDQVLVTPEQPFIITDLGNNVVTQIVKSDVGCTDSAFLSIEVVPAVLDLVLQNIRYINDRGNIVFVADIVNNGSAQIKDMIISLDIDGTVVLKEKLIEFMNAGDKLTRILSSSLESEPRFVCFTIDAANSSLLDADPQDNRICINFGNETFFMSPYPNPASDKVLIPIILKENQEVTIEILSSNGITSFKKSIIGVKSELITYEIDLNELKQGYYFVKVTSGAESKAFPIVIKR